MYGAEVFLHQAILNSSIMTKDPHEANLFYIPFYQSCYLHSTDDKNKSVDQVMLETWQIVRTQHPWWNVTNGRNHFWILTHDRGLHTLFSDTNVSSWEQKKDILNSFGLTMTAQVDWFFRPGWDISIPPFTQGGFLNFKGVERVNPTNRTVFASFKGIIPPDSHYSYSNGVRQWLYHTRNQTNFSVYGAWGGLGDDDLKKWSYGDYMVNSIFCLCPPGLVSWTPRIVNAIVSGCIPVIIGDGYYLPFRDFVDYSSFSVLIPRARVSDIHSTLHAISNEQVSRMQEKLKQIYRFFIYEKTTNGTIFIMQMIENELALKLMQNVMLK
jgi:hypothetical protein